MKTWRTKAFHLQLTSHVSLETHVRRFRTSKARRSQKYKQLVVPLQLGSLREISFRLIIKHGRRRNPHHPILDRSADFIALAKKYPATKKFITQLVIPNLFRNLAAKHYSFLPGFWFRDRNNKATNFWQLQASWSWLLILVGVLGLGISTSQLVLAQSPPPVKEFAIAKHTPAVQKPKSLPASQPTRIQIPSVSIDADIISVGLDDHGSIELPPLFDWKAGWYNGSPTPGQIGPSVIVGHLDTTKNISVFWNLRNVQPGTEILISRADGTTAHFKVTSLANYDQSNFPAETVYGNVPDAQLRLITCGGTFDTATHSYTQNTVVTATLTD